MGNIECMAKLIDHLKETGEKVSPFARRVGGISIGGMAKIVSGTRQPSLDLALRIEDATKGAVTCRDLAVDYKTGTHYADVSQLPTVDK